MKERVKKYLLMEKKKEAVEGWIAKKTAKNPIEVYINKPTRPIYEVEEGSSPRWGAADAKVTIVEFSDFQCPYCKQGAEILKQIKNKYGKKVTVVFKNFPLPFHTNAKGAAIAALCANEQGSDKFWRLHDFMFANQAALTRDALKEAVGNAGNKLGLDKSKFASCLDSNKYLKAVEADMEAGRKVGVKSTPTFFVNGMIVNGARPMAEFSELIDAELAK